MTKTEAAANAALTEVLDKYEWPKLSDKAKELADAIVALAIVALSASGPRIRDTIASAIEAAWQNARDLEEK